MDHPLYASLEAEALPTGTYLGLYHGRADPRQNMDDWGFNGPVIGPIDFAHTTYGNEIKVRLRGQVNIFVIAVVDDCVSFEGKFYGDWMVYQHTQRRVKDIPVPVERRKKK